MGHKKSPTIILCFRELTAVRPCGCSEQLMKNCCLTKVLSFWVAQLPQILSLRPRFGNCSCFEQPRLLSVLAL